MAVFAYRALAHDGSHADGIVDASSLQAAWAQLRDRGLYPTRLEPARRTRGARAAGVARRAAVVRQLAVLLRGGVPLGDARAIAGDTAPAPLQAAIATVAATVREGAPLADACRRAGALLDETECAIVAAGEASGGLAAALRDVALDLERTARRQRTLRQLLTYPVVLLVVSAGVLALLAVVVLPEIEALFADRRAALPLATRALLAARATAVRAWWVPLAVAPLLLVAGRRWARRPATRRHVDELLLRTPLLGPLVRDTGLARFAHGAARMLRAGIPLDDALAGAAGGVRSTVLRDELTGVRRAVREGRPLRAALAGTRAASPALLGLVGTGEETGALGDAFAEIAAMYDEAVDARVRSTFALLEPALIVSVAGVVLALVSAILVPFLTLDPLGPR